MRKQHIQKFGFRMSHEGNLKTEVKAGGKDSDYGLMTSHIKKHEPSNFMKSRYLGQLSNNRLFKKGPTLWG